MAFAELARVSYLEPGTVSVGRIPSPSPSRPGLPFPDGFGSTFSPPPACQPLRSRRSLPSKPSPLVKVIIPSEPSAVLAAPKPIQAARVDHHSAHPAVPADQPALFALLAPSSPHRSDSAQSSPRSQFEALTKSFGRPSPRNPTATDTDCSLNMHAEAAASLIEPENGLADWLSQREPDALSKLGQGPSQPEYPKVGDLYNSLELFRSTCLVASRLRGHDMGVPVGVPSQSDGKFTLVCRPPSGVSCPFQITAVRLSGSSEEHFQWKVAEFISDHGPNHTLTPPDFGSRSLFLGPQMHDLPRNASYSTASDTDDETLEGRQYIVGATSWTKLNTARVIRRETTLLEGSKPASPHHSRLRRSESRDTKVQAMPSSRLSQTLAPSSLKRKISTVNT